MHRMTSYPYETSDVYLASFLFSQGAKLISHHRVGPRRTIYRFVSNEQLHELLRIYWRQDTISFVPARLFSCLQHLKSVSRLQALPPLKVPSASSLQLGPNGVSGGGDRPSPSLPEAPSC